ncbi:MAG: glycosyltransferase family 39 protein, partial [Methylotetracoccus sp.]|nr:glycosyltransferase family 39 protein [Methylotetracoccus sp.]
MNFAKLPLRPGELAVWALISATSLLVIATTILASVPPVDRDALTHHLAVPKLYLEHGSMVEIPWVTFSYYPMNLDLLYLMPLYLGQDIAAKYIHFGFALLTAASIYGYLRRRTGSTVWALLGGLLFLSLPVIVKLSITVYVDLGLIYFSTASLLLLMRWADSGGRLHHLVGAGALCGLAMGTKYNGLLTFFLLTCFVPLAGMRRADSSAGPSGGRGKSLRAVGAGVLFAAVALAAFSPWMIRNALWTGNPVYPLYDGLFRPAAVAAPVAGGDAAGAEGDGGGGGMNHLAARRVVYGESFLETVATPLRIFFQGQDDNPKYFDGRLNPCLLLLPPAAFIGTRKLARRLRGESALLAAFAGLYLVFAFAQTDMRVRYVAPIIGPLVILSVLGLRSLTELAQSRVSSGAAAGLAAAAALLIVLPNLGYILDLFAKVQPIDYLAGRVSRDEYIQRHRPEYAAFRYANRQLPADAKVLGVFLGNRRYYCDRTLVFDGTLEAAVKTAGSARDVAARVREKG